MKKFVVIPDSFKGSMTSEEICTIMQTSILSAISDAVVIKIPIADGGEGTVDSFLAAHGGEKVTVTVAGPYMEKIQADYGIIHNGHTAVVELASCAGLPLVGNNKNPLKTTTYGVGELILHAIQISGCREIIVGLGGSCTHDFAAGLLAALGVRFYDQEQKSFIPTGGTLKQVVSIDTSIARQNLDSVSIMAMCDIQNPLCGEKGAAHIFAPQKGADAEMVRELDAQLYSIAELVSNSLGVDCRNIPGAGAAGGAGGGMLSLIGASLKSGIDTILDAVNYDELITDADLVFTGEGRIDDQSANGKVIAGLAKRCKQQAVPLVALVGEICDPLDKLYALGLTSVFSINRAAVDLQTAMPRSKENLRKTMDNIVRLLCSVKD